MPITSVMLKEHAIKVYVQEVKDDILINQKTIEWFSKMNSLLIRIYFIFSILVNLK